jgi:hypothetical protein
MHRWRRTDRPVKVARIDDALFRRQVIAERLALELALARLGCRLFVMSIALVSVVTATRRHRRGGFGRLMAGGMVCSVPAASQDGMREQQGRGQDGNDRSHIQCLAIAGRSPGPEQ